MKIEDFFILGEKLPSATLQAHPENLNFSADGKTDDVVSLLKGNYDNIDFPVIFKQAYGNRLDDVLRTGHGILFLISDRMYKILKDNNFSGWRIFPIRLLKRNGTEIIGYHGLSITGKCGSIDYEKSDKVEKSVIPNGPPFIFYKGLHIGINAWDGTDFFLPDDYLGIVCTKRAETILRKSNLTNLVFENLAKIEIPDIAVPQKDKIKE